MLYHNLLLALRSFRRYKGSFIINLAGLASGFACAFLIYLWVADELSVDAFFENDSQLYQVMKTYPNADGTISTGEETPSLLAPLMVDDVPEVEAVVSTIGRSTGTLTLGDKHMKARPHYVGKDFFKVFSYDLLHGDRQKSLTEKYGIVITDVLALKLFNTTDDVVGKTLAWEGENPELKGAYTVTGIVKAPPANASFQFDVLFSYAVYYNTFTEKFGLASWYSNSSHTYALLKAGTDVDALNNRLKDYSVAKHKQLHGSEGLEWEGRVFLQQYSSKYLHGAYVNGMPSGGRIEYVRLFSIIAVFILVIACINFMNLSTAQASRRMKEIGIKKSIGVGRYGLVFQYLCESVVLSCLALVLALIVSVPLLSFFNDITGKHVTLDVNTGLVVFALGVAVATGILAGSYPAFYLSGFNTVAVLKGQLNSKGGESWIRKGLVVFQFSISIVLILSVLVVYKQIYFIQTKNLGYNRDNILLFTNEGKARNHMETFLAELKNIPGVVNTASMGGDLFGYHGGGGGVSWEGKQPDQGVEFGAIYADYNLLELLGLELVAGRTYSRDFKTDADAVIFNETAIATMNLKDPVGKTVVMWGHEKKIIGVVKDFHYESLYHRVEPFFFRMPDEPGECENILVKIKAGAERETVARIQKFYSTYNEGLPLEYRFMNDDFNKLYASEQRVASLSQYFAGIAILISCLGLFGLAVFTAERRVKEIGIRKILGASVAGIVYLLSGEFTKIVLTAIIIALPLSYMLAAQWLDSFAFRIELQWWYFAGAALLALVVAWLTVGTQALKAATANPSNSLRSE
ncbi:ABC transporter permease [Chryseolinea lacunae]|uniref:ABC transporter permease n=1 Tax=Chryseolinea lacunae TaxID=2801331 RepID=A0ABS1KNE9_9BACT|nr:ABC transporter permease [Chryseolinea lacunae]MBL0740772.1 ABC transporter permease [Chryseolinea lacunae]